MPITKVDMKPAHEQEQLNAMSWQELVDKKKQQLAGAIPAKWKLDVSLVKELTEANGGRLLELDPARRSGVLDDVELDITENYSAVKLVNLMTLGRLTATQVVTAFCKRAAVAQQLVSPSNCEPERQSIHLEETQLIQVADIVSHGVIL